MTETQTFGMGEQYADDTPAFVDPAFEDRAAAGTGALKRRTPLDDLREELQQEVERKPITIGVPRRSTIKLRFNTEIDADVLAAWRRKARTRTGRRTGNEELDIVKFSALVIANQCEAILRNGVEVPAENGEPLSFQHASLHEMVGAMSAIDAVKRLYGVDGDVINVAAEIVEAAGFGDEALDVDEDPTPAR